MPRRATDWSSPSMVSGVMMLSDVAHVAVTHRCVAWFGHPPLPYTARGRADRCVPAAARSSRGLCVAMISRSSLPRPTTRRRPSPNHNHRAR